jgi:peptidoglycan/LPS O-acetylase OafA/YrhL
LATNADLKESLCQNPRYRSLDLWRGAICLYIILEHGGVALWPGGTDDGPAAWFRTAVIQVLNLNIGTGLFFVISGYCMLASADSARRKSQSAASFVRRRFWRIVPTYWVALLSFAAIVTAIELSGRTDLIKHGYGHELPLASSLNLWQWLGNIGLFETWRYHFGGGPPNVLTRVAWSLCFQEQFYAVCALVLWLAPKRFFRAILIANFLILALWWTVCDIGAARYLAGFAPERWLDFSLGMAVFARLNIEMSALRRRLLTLVLVAVPLWAAWGVVATHGTFHVSTLAAGLFAATLALIRRFDSQICEASVTKPFQALGRISYSVYLIHLPVCVIGAAWLLGFGVRGFWGHALITLPAITLGSILVGWIFFQTVECHFVNPNRLPAQQPATPLALNRVDLRPSAPNPPVAAPAYAHDRVPTSQRTA